MASHDHRIHSFKKCVPEGSDYFQQTLGRRRSSSLKIKLSYSKEDPSINEEYEDLNSWRTAYPPQHLDKKRCYHEWRRWWSWRLKKEYTHETNKDKYSIVISWYCFVIHLIIFSWCIFCINDCILLICMWWVSSSWCYTTLHCYLSRMKPLHWHIGLLYNLNVVLVEMEGI